jgi:hypothetical protein
MVKADDNQHWRPQDVRRQLVTISHYFAPAFPGGTQDGALLIDVACHHGAWLGRKVTQ